MSDTPEHRHSTSALGFLGWAILLAAIGGGGWRLHEEVKTLQASGPSAVTEELKAQGMAIAELKSQLEQWRTAPADAMNATALEDIRAQLTALNQRLDALQAAKPAPTSTANNGLRLFLALQTNVTNGAAYAVELDTISQLPELKNAEDAIAALRIFAAQGLPTDASLRQELNRLLVQQSAPGATSVAGNVNTHLGGLITIKKHADSSTDFLNLPADTPIVTLVEKVNTMPEASRAVYQPWLERVALRDKARQALATLQNTLFPPQ